MVTRDGARFLILLVGAVSHCALLAGTGPGAWWPVGLALAHLVAALMVLWGGLLTTLRAPRSVLRLGFRLEAVGAAVYLTGGLGLFFHLVRGESLPPAWTFHALLVLLGTLASQLVLRDSAQALLPLRDKVRPAAEDDVRLEHDTPAAELVPPREPSPWRARLVYALAAVGNLAVAWVALTSLRAVQDAGQRWPGETAGGLIGIGLATVVTALTRPAPRPLPESRGRDRGWGGFVFPGLGLALVAHAWTAPDWLAQDLLYATSLGAALALLPVVKCRGRRVRPTGPAFHVAREGLVERHALGCTLYPWDSLAVLELGRAADRPALHVQLLEPAACLARVRWSADNDPLSEECWQENRERHFQEMRERLSRDFVVAEWMCEHAAPALLALLAEGLRNPTARQKWPAVYELEQRWARGRRRG